MLHWPSKLLVTKILAFRSIIEGNKFKWVIRLQGDFFQILSVNPWCRCNAMCKYLTIKLLTFYAQVYLSDSKTWIDDMATDQFYSDIFRWNNVHCQCPVLTFILFQHKRNVNEKMWNWTERLLSYVFCDFS